MITQLIFRDLKVAPSLNVIMRETRFKKKPRKDTLIWLIKEQTKDRHKGTVVINFTRYACLDNLLDWDNMGASFKFIGDALVASNVITDDNPLVVVDFIVRQVQVSKRAEQKIVVKIESI